MTAGVTKHQKGKWEARIGTMLEKKYKYAPALDDEAVCHFQKAHFMP